MSKRIGSLEVGEDLQHEVRVWKVERVSWVIWALILIAALVGLLGPGPLSKAKKSDAAGLFQVEYNKRDRYQSPTELKIKFNPEAVKDGQVRCSLNRRFIETISLERIDPDPEHVATDGDQFTYTFNVSEVKGDVLVIFRYEATKSGRVPVRVAVGDAQALSFSQFFFP